MVVVMVAVSGPFPIQSKGLLVYMILAIGGTEQFLDATCSINLN